MHEVRGTTEGTDRGSIAPAPQFANAEQLVDGGAAAPQQPPADVDPVELKSLWVS